MNKIDPDEDEDEDGNLVPSERPATSYKTRAPQAQELANQYNNTQQMNSSTVASNTNATDDGPARSNHQPHQQAWLKYQEEQKKLQASQPQKESRETRERQSSRSSSHHHRDRDRDRDRDHHRDH